MPRRADVLSVRSEKRGQVLVIGGVNGVESSGLFSPEGAERRAMTAVLSQL